MFQRLDARPIGLRPESLTTTAIVAAFAAAGVLAGIVVASGKPIPIALVLGTIIGIALLNTLSLVVWVVLIGTLLVSGPVVMFAPELEKATWAFSMLGFLLAGAAILHSTIGRRRQPGPTPDFVVLALCAASLGLLSLLYSGGSWDEGIRAVKRYFQYFGLMFALAIVPFTPGLIRRWWKFVIFLAIVQVPFTLAQRVFLLPTLENRPEIYPPDLIVGTMEGSLAVGGGSSSVMALVVVFAISYLLSLYRERLMPTARLALTVVVLAIPLVIGEVTLIVVLVPLALAAVFHDFLRVSPLRALGGVVLAATIAGAGGWIYLMLNAEPGWTMTDSFKAVVAYNFGTIGYFEGSLNRTSVLTHWLQNHGLHDPIALVFGHGLGASFGGPLTPDPGHMSLRYPRLQIGLTAASSLLWDLGLAGLSIFILVYFAASRAALRLVGSANPGFDRAFCRALLAMSWMLIVMLFYSNGPISVPSLQVLTALTLGLIAWRQRSGALTGG